MELIYYIFDQIGSIKSYAWLIFIFILMFLATIIPIMESQEREKKKSEEESSSSKKESQEILPPKYALLEMGKR